MSNNVSELKEGDVVVALRHIRSDAAKVRIRKGTIGVVHNTDGLVFWLTGGACKVSSDDVERKGSHGQKLSILMGMIVDE
jgi:hypothetical protein